MGCAKAIANSIDYKRVSGLLLFGDMYEHVRMDGPGNLIRGGFLSIETYFAVTKHMHV